MSDLTTLPGFNPAQPHTTLHLPAEPILLDTSGEWLLPPSKRQVATQDSPPKSASGHRRRHKRHSKKKLRKQQVGGYILQLIGLICLVLAAVKAFEPLTGVGFSLVVMGYKGGLGGEMESKSRKKTKKRIKGKAERGGRLVKEKADDE